MKAVGAGNYNTFKEKFISDQTGLSTQDFLEQICGVRINNKDTGAITGSDAGSKTTKTAESIVPESTAAKVLTDDEYNSFTKNGLKVNIIYAGSDADKAKQRLAVSALYNWWIPESLDLINESLGVNFTDGRANLNEITIKFTTSYSNDVQVDIDYDLGRASNATLTINAALLRQITSGDKNGVLSSSKGYIHSNLYNNFSSNYATYLDQLVLHALSIVALTANVSYVDKLPREVALGLIELVGGYDSSTTNLNNFINSLASQYYGYTLMRYLAKNYSGLPAGLSYNSDKTVLTASTAFTGDTIDLAEFEGTVKTVNAAALTKGVNIIGNTLNNSLVGGTGADSLSGGAGNDTLTGGAGNDVFIYSGGKDVITDYATGQDKIKISSGTISKSTLSGNNVVFTVGGGTLTVNNGKGKSLSMIDSAGKSFSTIFGGSTTSTLMTVTNSTKSPVTVGADIKNINASSRTSAVKITGNALANSIVGGSGNDTLDGGAGNDSLSGGNGNDSLFGGAGNDVLKGDAGNDSLSGGAGNDTLTGGAGNDVFIYSGGNDVITDYAAGQDKIKISSGTISKSTLSGNNVVFTVGGGTITVNNGKGKSLSMIDSAGKSFSTILGGSTTSTLMTVTNSTKSPVTVGADIKNINASSRTSAVKITGNALANSIVGGSGNDTLDGGKGNDSLWGNAGADVFLYSEGEGSDVIYGFANNDLLLITGAFTSTYNSSKKEIAFKVGSTANAVTLKDYTATSFNINGYSYGISGTKLVKK